ncbi:MAG: hypothetical protein IKU55_05255 [Clostridia bacterium]|nr:hypothetical protein [Clostridia bacterium]
MKKPDRHTFFLFAGIGLIAVASIALLVWQWRIHAAKQQAEDCVALLRTLIPTPQGTVLEERRDNTMSVLALDGTDFLGILEMPRYASALPVGADWGESSQYPCRFSGSLYDGTLQIGATSQTGQYDFYREISVGDTLYFTDVTGSRYAYTVADLRYEDHADQAALERKEADLTIFIKNVYATEYIILFCNSVG